MCVCVCVCVCVCRNELLLVAYPRGKAKLDLKVAWYDMKDMNSDRQIQSPER